MIQNNSIRIKKKINLSGISRTKFKKPSLIHSDSEHLSRPVSLTKSLLSFPKGSHDSGSPTVARSRDPLYYRMLINIEENLVKNKDLDLKDQYDSVCYHFDELIRISPELTIILNNIQGIASSYIDFIVKSADEKIQQANEDFKRLSKRYRKMSFEVMGLQEKLKKKKEIIFDLKSQRNELTAKIKEKNIGIIELESQINMLKVKNQKLSDMQFCSQPVKACRTLTIAIPEKNNFLLYTGQDSALMSEIEVINELEPTHNDLDLLLSSIEKDSISPEVDDKISPGMNQLVNNLDKNA